MLYNTVVQQAYSKEQCLEVELLQTNLSACVSSSRIELLQCH